MAELDRAALLCRAVKGAAVLSAAGIVAALAEPAAAGLGDADLAWARVVTAAELASAAFYVRLAASSLFGSELRGQFRRALLNEREHYRATADILVGAGQMPAVAEDFDFTFPTGAFAIRGRAARLGVTLEAASVGAYLGGVAALQDDGLKTVFARIAASEAEHLALFSRLAANRPVGISFPEPLDFETASNAIAPLLG